jgi:lysophospholipase L1-like esterase
MMLGNIRSAPFDTAPGDGRCVGLKAGAAVTYTGWFRRVPAVVQEANRQGFRGPERPRRKPGSVFRILMLGDSTVYGQGVSTQQTLPAHLERELKGATGHSVEVLNFGVPGYNLEESIDQYQYLASRWDHDLVLLKLVSNDLKRPLCDFLKRPATAWLVLNVAIFRVIYIVLVPKISPPDDRIKTGGAGRIRRALKRLRRLADGRGARLAVITTDRKWVEEQTGTKLEEITTSQSVPLFDLIDCPGADKTADHPFDDIPGDGHLSGKGNGQAAACLSRWLQTTSGLLDTE